MAVDKAKFAGGIVYRRPTNFCMVGDDIADSETPLVVQLTEVVWVVDQTGFGVVWVTVVTHGF